MQPGLKSLLYFANCSEGTVLFRSISASREGAWSASRVRATPHRPAKMDVRVFRVITLSSNLKQCIRRALGCKC
jgi:hypothetical protein